MTRPPGVPAAPPAPSSGPPGTPPPQSGPGAAVAAPSAPISFKTRTVRKTGPRIVFAAVEKFGKTTLAAYAPSPLLLMGPNESGYDKLLELGKVPAIPAESVESWTRYIQILDHLIANPSGIQTLAIDALGGFESLCKSHHAAAMYGGSMEKFEDFGRGYKVAGPDWSNMLGKLETLSVKHGMTIVLLAHIGDKAITNADGVNFDGFAVDVNKNFWNATARWADNILRGDFFIEVRGSDDVARGKGKAVGKPVRTVYTAPTATFRSAGRYTLPPQIILDNDPTKNWSDVMSHFFVR